MNEERLFSVEDQEVRIMSNFESFKLVLHSLGDKKRLTDMIVRMVGIDNDSIHNLFRVAWCDD